MPMNSCSCGLPFTTLAKARVCFHCDRAIPHRNRTCKRCRALLTLRRLLFPSRL